MSTLSTMDQLAYQGDNKVTNFAGNRYDMLSELNGRPEADWLIPLSDPNDNFKIIGSIPLWKVNYDSILYDGFTVIRNPRTKLDYQIPFSALKWFVYEFRTQSQLLFNSLAEIHDGIG